MKSLKALTNIFEVIYEIAQELEGILKEIYNTLAYIIECH